MIRRKIQIVFFKGTGMLDDILIQVKEAEEEAKKILARGNKEAERILKKLDNVREAETSKAMNEVKTIMAQLEKIKLEEARVKAEEIRGAGEREIQEIKEKVKPRMQAVTEDIKNTIIND